MKLYHGSNQAIAAPKLLKPTHPMDFEQGFYTTANYSQAVAFAKKVVRWRGGIATVSIIDLLKFAGNKNVK